MAKPMGVEFILLLALSLFIASVFLTKLPKSTSTHKVFGVKIIKNPPHSMLHKLAVSTWPKWRGELGKIPWTFKQKETMYLLEGKVKVCVDGHDDEGCFEIGGGDLAVFPKGMKITWEVFEAVSKHYKLEK